MTEAINQQFSVVNCHPTVSRRPHLHHMIPSRY
uniref:Uncharacterized protein n=1 Tax=Rhizophora mucronata TaxID=61149 RepID=A0A2P2NEI5_RHIMU